MKLKSETYNNIEMPIQLVDYLHSIEDGYDDPYFVLVKAIEDINLLENNLKESLDSEEEVYSSDSLKIDDEHLFLVIDCEISSIHAIFDSFVQKHNEMNKTIYVSIFKHNALGKPNETYKWCTQLLDEAIEQSNNKSLVLYNDFSDRGNWPGIKKYMEQY